MLFFQVFKRRYLFQGPFFFLESNPVKKGHKNENGRGAFPESLRFTFISYFFGYTTGLFPSKTIPKI